MTDPNEGAPQNQSTMTNLIEKDSAKTPELPREVIIDILSRLSVKNVLQLRCVSKSWRSLISEPYLIKKHHRHIHMIAREGNYTNHGVIMSYRQYSPFKACSLNSIYNEEEFDAIDLKYNRSSRILYSHGSPLYSYIADSVVGSCNGLLCVQLGNEEGVALWNPTIKQFRYLPYSGIRKRDGNYRSQSFVYGFGYDETSDDYKVVAILKILGRAASAETEVGVYSLRSDSWRRIQSFPCNGLPDASVPCSTLVSGSLVWPVLCYTGNRPPNSLTWMIVALDLASETYQKIPPPVVCHENFDLTLGEVGGCLGILARHINTFAEVWVMKEFGMRESWTKLIKLPFRACMPSYKPLNLTSYGVMFTKDYDCRLCLFNFKSEEYFPSSPKRDNYYSVASCVYIESLVSPNAEQGLEGNNSES